jgi:hypothetical protein
MTQWINLEPLPQATYYADGGTYWSCGNTEHDLHVQLNLLQSTTRDFRPIIEHKDLKALPSYCIKCDKVYGKESSEGLCESCLWVHSNLHYWKSLRDKYAKRAFVPEHQLRPRNPGILERKQKPKRAAFWSLRDKYEHHIQDVPDLCPSCGIAMYGFTSNTVCLDCKHQTSRKQKPKRPIFWWRRLFDRLDDIAIWISEVLS